MNSYSSTPRHNGRLIVVEGIDGSGKGTLFTRLVPALTKICKRKGIPLVVSKEPGGTYTGNIIRDLLFQEPTTKRMHPDLPSLLMLGSHLQHMHEKVLPALRNGAIVLLDRYWYSHYAYQPGRGGHQVFTLAYDLLRGPEADLILFLRGDPFVLLERAITRQGEDHQKAKNWSNLEAQQKVLAEYDHMFADKSNVHRLDALDAPEAVYNNALIGLRQLGLYLDPELERNRGAEF